MYVKVKTAILSKVIAAIYFFFLLKLLLERYHKHVRNYLDSIGKLFIPCGLAFIFSLQQGTGTRSFIELYALNFHNSVNINCMQILSQIGKASLSGAGDRNELYWWTHLKQAGHCVLPLSCITEQLEFLMMLYPHHFKWTFKNLSCSPYSLLIYRLVIIDFLTIYHGQ